MELKQYQKMSLQLVMTPQLQQAIKLLQLSRLELSETVQNELLENPVLEIEAEAQSQSPAEVGREIDKAKPDREDVEIRSHEADPTEANWEQYVSDYNSYSYTPGGGGIRYSDDDMPTIEQTLAGQQSLTDHLEWQLGLALLTDDERAIGEAIIGNITPAGYLPAENVQQIADEMGIELSDVESVLEVVQEFDPLGVGARDLRECLLIQARVEYPDEDIVLALIDRHLENLEKKNVAAITKDLDCDVEDISEAIELIGHLEPRPGRGFATEDAQYITPDVYVHKVGDEYLVQLNEDGLPKLKISNFYQNQLKNGAVSSKEKDFIQDKFRSAVWLIRSIHQRQNTIRKVTESIVRFQREFLDYGVERLRPLILRDVADDIGMHESTISRVTTNKYVHTPQGIFELKYFFNSRITSSQGGDLASESVKQRIKKLISEENPKKPLSDQKLCDILGEEGTQIARRTVAKYREMLNILPSSKRKKVF
ncbi:MAG: RNA polymerase sigma-54 factor [Deltaproteobacteria bacterium]|nr:MAG: RNA polymerase sigma-54 factor [Deltaproteobacteria bacterium]